MLLPMSRAELLVVFFWLFSLVLDYSVRPVAMRPTTKLTHDCRAYDARLRQDDRRGSHCVQRLVSGQSRHGSLDIGRFSNHTTLVFGFAPLASNSTVASTSPLPWPRRSCQVQCP